jgi:hypothetical protein
MAALTYRRYANITVWYFFACILLVPYGQQTVQGIRAVPRRDNWGGGGGGGRVHIHIFVFCATDFFWKWLFLRYVNMNIWISTPQLSRLVTALQSIQSFVSSYMCNSGIFWVKNDWTEGTKWILYTHTCLCNWAPSCSRSFRLLNELLTLYHTTIWSMRQ